MAKYKGKFKKGMHVHRMLSNFGGPKRRPDFERLYVIRNIGPRQTILDRIDLQTCKKIRSVGETCSLYPRESWSEVLFPAPKAGWDPEINV